MNNAVTKSSEFASSESRRCRLTSEDLRKQMRIRESSSWITKHNELIKSTGSLRVGESSDPQQESIRARKSRVWKGFACRKWASEFLPADRSDGDEEYTPFTVRQYVDKSSHATGTKTLNASNKVEPSAVEGRTNEERGKNQLRDAEDVNVQTSLVRMDSETSKPEEEHDSEVQSLSPTEILLQQTEVDSEEDFMCPCKIDICNAPAFLERAAPICQDSGRIRALTAPKSSRKSKPLGIALPLKQFPPINPLRDAKKLRSVDAQKRRDHGKRERPHTVDPACTQRGLLNSEVPLSLERRSRVYLQAPRGIVGSRISSCPPLNWKTEKRNASAPVHGCSQLMLEAKDTLRHVDYDLDRWSDTSSQQSHNDVGKVHIGLLDHKKQTLPGARNSSVKFHPQSSRRKDRITSAVSDVSENGLGSEFELSSDGLNKLEVFLKPWTDHVSNWS